VLLTLILFNCFNISYSFAIYYRFSDSLDSLNMATSIMSLAALLLMVFLVTYASPDGFGEFKDKFKLGFV
jgi:type III secretory pathway component EscT